MKKIELKVNISCQKCKTQVLKAVTKLDGIEQVAVDVEKGLVTVIGEADPVRVANQIRKTGKAAEMISVGAPKKPDPPENNPEPAAKPQPFPPSCPACQVFVSYDPYGETCTIL